MEKKIICRLRIKNNMILTKRRKESIILSNEINIIKSGGENWLVDTTAT